MIPFSECDYLDFGVLFVVFVLFCLWLHWVFAAVHRLSLAVVNVGYSPAMVRGLLIAERWLLLLQSSGSRHVGCSSYGAGA